MSESTAEFQIQEIEKLDVWIPMRRYQLELKHVLLSRLGGISRYLLFALRDVEVTLDIVSQITGLSHAQLAPIVGRLEALSLIEAGALTSAGVRLSDISLNLHEKCKTIWLDLQYSDAPLMVLGDGLVQKKPAELVEGVWMGGAPTPESPKELNQQRHRLQWRFPAYLVNAFPQCCVEPEQTKKDKQRSEWDIELHPDEGYEGYGLPVQVCRAEASSDGSHGVHVASPVSCLRTTYSEPTALRDLLPADLPTPVMHCYSHADHQKLVSPTLHDTPPVDFRSEPVAQWPDISAASRAAALAALAVLREDVNVLDRTCSSLLDRKHEWIIRWESLHFSKQMLREKCRQVEGVVWKDSRYGGY